MAEKLAAQGHDPIIIDNDSTYPPLLEWYSSCPYDVRMFGVNGGHTAPWDHLLEELNQDYYVVTDPDLDISELPDDWPEALREGIDRYDDKCGLSLLEAQVPKQNPAWFEDGMYKFPPGEHPERWGPELYMLGDKCRFIGIHVDTTFAMYKPGTQYGVYGVRSAPPYSAHHLPWHIVPKVNPEDSEAIQIPIDDEIAYYFEHANESSCTLGRLRTWRTLERRHDG